MKFDDQVTAGVVLVREDIRSQNYAPGAAGWIIEAAGNAEFNAVTIRGTIVVGTPPNAQITIHTVAGTGRIDITSGDALEVQQGTIVGGVGTFAGYNVLETSISSPSDVAGIANRSYIRLMKAYNPAGPEFIHMETGTLYIDPAETNGVVINMPNSTDNALCIGDSTGTAYALFVRADGQLEWSNGAAVPDTFLFRSGVAELRIQDDLVIDGEITSYHGNTFHNYTPTWTDLGGATFSTNRGRWERFGKLVWFNIYAVVNGAGAGANPITVTAPTNIDRTNRQVVTANVEDFNAAGTLILSNGTVIAAVTGAGAVWDRIRMEANDANTRSRNLTASNLVNGTLITIEGWYREA